MEIPEEDATLNVDDVIYKVKTSKYSEQEQRYVCSDLEMYSENKGRAIFSISDKDAGVIPAVTDAAFATNEDKHKDVKNDIVSVFDTTRGAE